MAEGKWITELTANTPLPDAARRVLMVRMEVVRDYLPKAVHHAAEDPENVHQLRVASRRAGAALRIFRSCFPDKNHRQARKRLRTVRRSAGEARDWDVFLIALDEKRRTAAVTHRPGLDFLFGYALAQRAAAQSHLDVTGTDYPYVLEQLQTDLAASIQLPNGHQGKPTLGEWARPMLSDLLAALETQAAGNLADYACLHQVRIAGKKLRYAMEVFADCFAPKFRDEIYPAVEAMQDILGAANDSQVASVRLSALRESLQKSWPAEWKQFRPGIEGLLRYHQSRLTRERKRFQGWWKRWEATGMERTLETLIH